MNARTNNMEKIEKIRKAFVEYVLENGQTPPSFFAFAKKLKMAEADLYEFYGSFQAIESDLWLSFFEQAKATAEAEEVYQTKYSVREKFLAVMYTWVEILKANRSFVVFSHSKLKPPVARNPQALGDFKRVFTVFAQDLLYEGRESREVQPRPAFISGRYSDALWMQTIYVLEFWIKDRSRGFEMTDSAIEKSVNTAFDLLAPSALDSILDFAKFVYQNR